MKKKYYLILILILLATTIGSISLNQLGVGKENVLMIFMVGVLLITAFTKGYGFGIIASCVSVMIFNYFFTEPLHTFVINSPNDMVLMIFFLIGSSKSVFPKTIYFVIKINYIYFLINKIEFV